MKMQTKQEIDSLCLNWALSHSPEDLILRGEVGKANGEAIAKYIIDAGKDFSIESLNSAISALGDYAYGGKLRYRAPRVVEKVVDRVVPAEPAKTPQQLFEETASKIKAREAAELAKLEAEKAVNAAKNAEAAAARINQPQIDDIIRTFTLTNRAGVTDIARTDRGKNKLRQIKGKDSAETLKLVRAEAVRMKEEIYGR
jgi:hypothetical protein